MLLQHTDSTALQAKAQEAGIFSFGQASDMSAYAPKPRISSIIDNWAPITSSVCSFCSTAEWETAQNWEGIGSGTVGIGEITDAVPAEVKAEALALKDKIAKGEYHPSPAR